MATTASNLSHVTSEETTDAPANHAINSTAESVTKSPTEPVAESVATPASEPVAPATTVPTIPSTIEPAVESIPTTADAAPPAIEHAAVIAAPADEVTSGEHAHVPTAEVVPIEEGVLEHKKTAGFPLNLIFREQTFWFGTGPTESKDLSSYIRNEKSYDVAHHNAAWASTTGAGLLFHGEKKGHISGIINLADASEPETDGALKFYLTHKGIKHTFRAQNTANRDNWVSQLKNKTTAAKGSVTSVTEDSSYKTALDSYKFKQPISPLPKEDAVKSEDPKTDARPDDGGSDSAEDKRDGRRSVSRKRLSVFFNRRNRKEDEKVEGDKTDEPSAPAESAAVADASEPAVATTGLTAETPTFLVSPTDTIGSSAETAAVQDKLPEDKKPTDTDATRSPPFTKRNSLFGLLKRDRKAPPSPIETDAVETIDAPTTATETAPVIPPVDTATTPLAVELSSPATVPTEIVDLTPATIEKKEIKADKRKSSLPFAFSKKEKSPGLDESSEKKDKGVFSRIRNTIKRYPSDRIDKTEDKTDVTGDKSDIPADEVSPPTTEPTADTTIESLAPVTETEQVTHDIPVVTPVTAAA